MPGNNYGFIRTEYSFTSGSGELESGRYINEYKIRIYLDEVRELGDEMREESVEIGWASVSLFLIELSMDNERSTFDVFDHSNEYVNLYEEIHTEGGEFIQPLADSFEGLNFNLLYIREIELLPEWRGRGIGKKVLKDIIWRFDGCCGMIVLKAYPLQLSPGILESTNLWSQRRLLSSLELNPGIAQRTLSTFFASVGFERVPDSDIHYMSPDRINPKLSQIPLDDNDEL